MSRQHRVEGWDDTTPATGTDAHRPYRRLAAAVILQAAHDIVKPGHSRDPHTPLARKSAWNFLFSDEPHWEKARERWFTLAGFPLPEKTALLSKIRSGAFFPRSGQILDPVEEARVRHRDEKASQPLIEAGDSDAETPHEF